MHILDPEEFVASAIAYPGSTEDVQKIILWANKYKVPIFPISLGRNCKWTHPPPSLNLVDFLI